MNFTEGLNFINSLISSSDTKHKVQSFFKDRYPRLTLTNNEPYEIRVGYWKRFMKRNKHILKISKGTRPEESCSKWTTYRNFVRINELICEILTEEKIAIELEETLMMDKDCNIVMDERLMCGLT